MRLRNGSPDRRHQERGTPAGEPSRLQLVSTILGTFREMPGLCLHGNQAARLFGLCSTTCQSVLDDLVAEGKLRRGADGQYLLGNADGHEPVPVTSPERHALALTRRGR